MENLAFRLSRLNAGSSKFGPCEVCGKSADSTYILTTVQWFNDDGVARFAYLGTSPQLYGHKDCLSRRTFQPC